MKEFLQNKIKSLKDRKTEISTKFKSCEDLAKLKAYQGEIEHINTEIDEFQKQLDKLDGKQKKEFNPIATYGIGSNLKTSAANEEDIECRKTFMDYVLKGGNQVPDTIKTTTVTGDIAAVIPDTILNKVVEKLNAAGMIYARVTKTSYQGGLSIPTASAKPTATWVSEGKGATAQKKSIDGKIVFAYHKLQCKVSISLETSIVSLAVFEQTVINNITEAMLIALEESIVNGDGNGKPKGILTKEVDQERIVSASSANIGTYDFWVGVESKIPLAYESTGVYLLSKQTWDKYCVGMVDKNGQPIARVTYGISALPERRLLGREVILTDYVPSFDAVENNNCFGCVVNLADYVLNSNLQMTIKKYEDNDTDDLITKATLLADGDLIDTNGTVMLKKAQPQK